MEGKAFNNTFFIFRFGHTLSVSLGKKHIDCLYAAADSKRNNTTKMT